MSTNRRTLKLTTPYMRDEGKYKDVSEAQTLLTKHGFKVDKIDGVFGPNTEDKAKAFQTDRKLTADGIIGTKTWAALDEAPPVPEDPDLPPLMREFFYYLDLQIKNHSIYVWGAQGEMHPVITEEWIRKKETSTTNANRAIKFWQAQAAAGYGAVLRAFDCSGLLMYWAQNVRKLLPADLSSEGIRQLCTQVGRSELKRGDFVFRVYASGSNKGKAYHIGYVVADGGIIHAKGRDAGVVRETLNQNGTSYWNWYGRSNIFVSGGVRDLMLTSPTLMRGDDVKALQETLLRLGYSVIGTADGVFGQKTDQAVREFQANASRMNRPGICDADMRKTLGL